MRDSLFIFPKRPHPLTSALARAGGLYNGSRTPRSHGEAWERVTAAAALGLPPRHGIRQ